MQNSYFDKISTTTLSRLNVINNTQVILGLLEDTEGHIYVSGDTGTGKSIIAQGLADTLGGQYQNYTCIDPTEWRLRFNDILNNSINGKSKIIIIDGIANIPDDTDFEMVLRTLRIKGVRLIFFTMDTVKSSCYLYGRRAVLSYVNDNGKNTVICTDVTLNPARDDTFSSQ